MLDDRELEVTLVMAESNMRRRLKDDGLEHDPDGRVLILVER